MTSAEALLTEIRDAVTEGNRWLKFLAAPLVRQKLQSVLTKKEELRVYQASDGSSREKVAGAAGVSRQTVSNYWKVWNDRRIVAETDTKGRYQRIYDLDELEMESAENDGNS